MALNYWNSGQKQLKQETKGRSFYVYDGQFVEDRCVLFLFIYDIFTRKM